MKQLRSIEDSRRDADAAKRDGLRTKAVPRGCGLGGRGSQDTVSSLRGRLREVFPTGLQLVTARSSESDDFATLTLKVPAPHGPHLDPERRNDTGAAALLNGVGQPLRRAAPVLRELAVECEAAGLMEPSRETHQLFAGYSGFHARAVALREQAFGIYDEKSYLDGCEHPLLEVPTLVSAKYVREGAIPMGDYLSCLTLAQHKQHLHCANLWFCIAGGGGHAPPLLRHETTVLCRKQGSRPKLLFTGALIM